MTQVIFYNTQDSQKTINKALTQIGTKDLNLLFSYNYLGFQVYLRGDPELLKSNYAKIDDKCYFLNLENLGGSVYIVTFTLDLLETYKDNILASDFDINEKSTPDFNTTVPTSSEVIRKTFKSDKELEFTNTVILNTIGEELQ